MIKRHRTTDPRLDDDDPEVPQPVWPEPREPSDDRPLSSPANELGTRLFGRRKVLRETLEARASSGRSCAAIRASPRVAPAARPVTPLGPRLEHGRVF